MQVIEIEAEIDVNHEIHIKLPASVHAKKARLMVMYESDISAKNDENQPLKLDLYKGKLNMSDDFDAPLPDDYWLRKTQ